MPVKPNAKFLAPVTPDAVLAAIIGPAPRPRTQIVKDLWGEIKKGGGVQQHGRNIIAVDNNWLKFLGQPQITMFQLAKCVSAHVTK